MKRESDLCAASQQIDNQDNVRHILLLVFYPILNQTQENAPTRNRPIRSYLDILLTSSITKTIQHKLV